MKNCKITENKVEVSVVVPTYNAAKFLHETILSILEQQDVNLELLIVDDCSDDETEVIIKEFASNDRRVRYLRMASNTGGPAGPRNYGVNNARGFWIAFCDADDLWHPQKLRQQIDIAHRDRADLVCSAIEDFVNDNKSILTNNELIGNLALKRMPYWQMLIKNRIATSSVLCRREVLLQSGGFNKSSKLVAVEDYDLWLRMMERRNFIVLRIGIPLVAYRRLPQSLSSNKLRLARRAMLVTWLASKRRGWFLVYPILLPLLFTGYSFMSLYWRVLKGKM